jgi:hypothetical protein
MTDQPTIGELLAALEINMTALKSRLSDSLVDRLVKERDALRAEVERLRKQMNDIIRHQPIKVSVTPERVIELAERAEKAEAALAEAGPLIEAVMETDILAYHDPDTDCPIITQALSYRAAMEAKGGKNG